MHFLGDVSVCEIGIVLVRCPTSSRGKREAFLTYSALLAELQITEVQVVELV